MSEPTRDLSLQFLHDFIDLKVIPASLTPVLNTYYSAIACDPELAALAMRKCSEILNDLDSHAPEVVKRCSQFLELLKEGQQPQQHANLILEQVDVNGTSDVPVLGQHQHLTNLIIEDIDVTKYVSD